MESANLRSDVIIWDYKKGGFKEKTAYFPVYVVWSSLWGQNQSWVSVGQACGDCNTNLKSFD